MIDSRAEYGKLFQDGSMNAKMLLIFKGFFNSAELTRSFFVYTINSMHYEFDPTKDEGNLGKHGVSLTEADGFEWEAAVVREDTRKQYAERRFEAKGYIGDRLHVMVFCLRDDAVRIISLRKANPREVKSYAET
jgi:uncharacterized DUF497 family protein